MDCDFIAYFCTNHTLRPAELLLKCETDLQHCHRGPHGWPNYVVVGIMVPSVAHSCLRE